MHGFDRNEAGKLFVGGLSWDTTKDSLLEYFTQYGEVIDCVVMKNPETGKSRGFGFVTYRDPNCVDTVLSVPAHIVDGRQVDPKACNPKGSNRGGGGGGQMGGEPNRMHRGPRGGGPQGDRKIFLGGLPNGVDEEAIRNFFSQYGKVLDVTVMYDAQKQRSRGFGFLLFESDDAVNQVCREHFVNFNGKKVECKRATPRNQGNNAPEELQPHQFNVSPGGMPPLEMGVQPPQHTPGPVPGPDPQWTSPEAWNPQVQQSPPPPPQVGMPPQFQQAVQFQPGYQAEVPAAAPPAWPQQAPPQSAGGWPPAGPGQQPGVAPGSAQFLPQPAVSQSGQPAPGAPVYQYATGPSAQQPAQANGQALQQVAGVGQPAPAPSSYGYTTSTYSQSAPGVALSQSPAGITARQYQDFAGSQQVQIATTMAPLQGTPAPVSTAVSYSAYPSPYAAPVPAGAAPTVAGADPYAQTAMAHPQGGVQVAAPGVAPAAGQPAGVPGYGSPIAQSPVPAGSGDPAAPKAVDYSSYYSAYGYAVETSPNAAVSAAYGAQPAPAPAPAPASAQAPYAPQEVPQAVAYGGAPSPTFQRQGSGQQFHPYRR